MTATTFSGISATKVSFQFLKNRVKITADVFIISGFGSGHTKLGEVKSYMKDSNLWGMFCETGEPFCYLLYRSAMKEKKYKPDTPPKDTLAFGGTGEKPRVRF